MQPLPTGKMFINELYKWMENPGLLNEETVIDLKNLVEEYPYFQVAWFVYLKNLKEIDHEDYETVLKKAAIRVPDRKQLYRFLNKGFSEDPPKKSFDYSETVHHSFHLNFDDEQNHGNSLIDKFLASTPGKIQRKEGIPESPDNSGDEEVLKNSVSENDEIITETLANIYFQQKKYDKALEAFRKLSLKYPEKSVYFAARIEEIENLKNI
jgi:tetratricopeptide (TPR) repeat protein